MHHSTQFAKYILGEGRYAPFPEIIEFYTGIDRRREDAVMQITSDLRSMNTAFLERTGIAEGFEPWQRAQWVPSEPSVEALLREVTETASDSTLPVAVKEAIADQSYDRAKPYRQELAKFINDSSLRKMMSAVKGAARALRNSDHVDPKLKMALMEEVVCCWRRICQIIAVLSPLLVEHRRAYFEGIAFHLDESFDLAKTDEARFGQVLSAIPGNIALWYQDDIFSRKMGALFSRYTEAHRGTLNESLILLVMATQRSPGWEEEIDSFIERSKKNSFYLSQLFSRLFSELRTSITNERTRQQLRRLAAKAVAKHQGSKHLSSKVIERTAKDLDKSVDRG